MLLALARINSLPEEDMFSNDFYPHLQYTQIISLEDRLPSPYEGNETYQPPLYYLINSLVLPHPNELDKSSHILSVKGLSILYGAISIFLIWLMLIKIEVPPIYKLLTLLFVITTPSFLFTFFTYTNDALASLLLIAIVSISYGISCSNKLTKKPFLLLLAVSTAAIYTKYNSFWCIAVISLICCRNFLLLKLPSSKDFSIIIVFILSVVLFIPWAYFHNYIHSGKYLPFAHYQESNIRRNLDISKRIKFLRSILNTPFSKEVSNKWNSPFVFPAKHDDDNKRGDYLSYSFITSVIAEYEYARPALFVIWTIIWIHLLMCLLGISIIFQNRLSILSVCFIVLSHLVQLLSLSNNIEIHSYHMAYRFLIWNVLPWSVLYTTAASFKIFNSNFIYSRLVLVLMSTGIAFQVYFLMTAVGNKYL